MEIPALIPLSAADGYARSEIGESAFLLHQAAKLKVPVADSVIITQAALEKIASQGNFAKQLEKALLSFSFKSDQLPAELEKIKRQIRQFHLPAQLTAPIINWYHLQPTFVSVSTDYKTDHQHPLKIENIKGEANLIESILALWSEQLQFDPKLKQLKLYAEPMLLQRQGQPEISGYVETRSDLSKTKAYIYSVWGVYQPYHPEIMADEVVVDIRTNQVVQRKNQLQYLSLERRTDHLQEKALLYYKQGELSMTDEIALDLASSAASLKRKFFTDCRLYWSYQQHHLVITGFERLDPAQTGVVAEPNILLTGDSLLSGIVGGRVVTDLTPKNKIATGDVLVVTELTSKHALLLKKVSAIVCDRGIKSTLLVKQLKEYHLPAVVNTIHATHKLKPGQYVIVNANSGKILQSPQPLANDHSSASTNIPTITKVYISAGNPHKAESYVTSAVDGVGVLRSEFTFARFGEHPLHLIKSSRRHQLKQELKQVITTYQQTRLNLPVIYRTQNFTTQELSYLTHASRYEPTETNPYLGFRGGIKMISEFELFDFELEVISEVLTDSKAPLAILLPFIRTPGEMRLVMNRIAKHQLQHHPHFAVYLQLNTPENVLQLKHYFIPGLAGVSVNSRSLHALMHGIDPDNPDLYRQYAYNLQLMEELLIRVQRVVHTVDFQPQALQTRPKMFLHLEDPSLELAEIAAKLNYDAITVKPEFAPRVKSRIRELEERRYG